MDGKAAIQNNIEALKRIVAGLVAMVGLGALPSPLEGEGGSARSAETDEGYSLSWTAPQPENRKGAGRPTLPRHLRLAILRLLRPAEAAARRLIIAAARGLVVTLPPARKTAPRPPTIEPQLRRLGIAVVVSPADIAKRAAAKRTTLPHPEVLANGEPRRTHLSLLDPPFRFHRTDARSFPAHAAPRILLPGYAHPHRLPPPPSRYDPIDATRLTTRLATLGAALDDLPAHARRFARWQALRQRRLQCAAAAESPSPLRGGARGGIPNTRDAGRRRAQRVSPLRPGRPPGGRLSRFDPAQKRGARIRDVDEVLAHAHALALHALNPPDTS